MERSYLRLNFTPWLKIDLKVDKNIEVGPKPPSATSSPYISDFWKKSKNICGLLFVKYLRPRWEEEKNSQFYSGEKLVWCISVNSWRGDEANGRRFIPKRTRFGEPNGSRSVNNMGSGVGRILVTESGREGPGPWSGAHSVHGSGGEGYWGKSQKLKKGKKGNVTAPK